MNPDNKPIFAGFSRNQLAEAFEKVQDKKHWKNPIDAIIQKEDISIVNAAIDFFAGGGAVFSIHHKGTRVTAPGYFVLIGA